MGDRRGYKGTLERKACLGQGPWGSGEALVFILRVNMKAVRSCNQKVKETRIACVLEQSLSRGGRWGGGGKANRQGIFRSWWSGPGEQ